MVDAQTVINEPARLRSRLNVYRAQVVKLTPSRTGDIALTFAELAPTAREDVVRPETVLRRVEPHTVDIATHRQQPLELSKAPNPGLSPRRRRGWRRLCPPVPNLATVAGPAAKTASVTPRHRPDEPALARLHREPDLLRDRRPRRRPRRLAATPRLHRPERPDLSSRAALGTETTPTTAVCHGRLRSATAESSRILSAGGRWTDVVWPSGPDSKPCPYPAADAGSSFPFDDLAHVGEGT